MQQNNLSVAVKRYFPEEFAAANSHKSFLSTFFQKSGRG